MAEQGLRSCSTLFAASESDPWQSPQEIKATRMILMYFYSIHNLYRIDGI